MDGRGAEVKDSHERLRLVLAKLRDRPGFDLLSISTASELRTPRA